MVVPIRTSRLECLTVRVILENKLLLATHLPAFPAMFLKTNTSESVSVISETEGVVIWPYYLWPDKVPNSPFIGTHSNWHYTSKWNQFMKQDRYTQPLSIYCRVIYLPII